MPLGKLSVTGPVTALPDCVNDHVMFPDTPEKVTLATQVPVTFRPDGVGLVIELLLLVQAAANRAVKRHTAVAEARAILVMWVLSAKGMPFGACVIFSAQEAR